MEKNSSMERRVNEESLNLIRWKMNHTPWLEMSTEEVDIAVEEYRRFLVLKMENPAVTLAPSGIMDKANGAAACELSRLRRTRWPCPHPARRYTRLLSFISSQIR